MNSLTTTHAQDLDPILKPRSIAVIGASRKANTIGHQIVHNLVHFGFTGPVYPVNPNAAAICSIPSSPTIGSIGVAPDLAIIAVPRRFVVEAAQSCADAGVKGLVVISAGFREVGHEGMLIEQELVRIVRTNGMRMVGPNCMGVVNTDPAFSMNATFAPVMPPAGSFAYMSQSGALGLSVLDYAQEYGIGISQFVSVGNKPDVSGNDLLLQWENDPGVDVILMYVENFGNPTRFLEIAKRVSRTKPIVALKSGRSTIGARAAASHTGALAASDRAIDALLTQAGVLRAYSMEELFDMAIAFGASALPRSRRTVVLTNSGGPGILAADAMAAYGLELPDLAPATLDALRTVLPTEASLRNPLDMIASAQPSSYRIALEALLADPGIDAAVAIFVPPMGVAQRAVAEAVVAAAATRTEKPVAAVLMGRHGLPQGRAELRDAGIPAYIFPESAARGLAAVNRYAEWIARPHSDPLPHGPPRTAVVDIIRRVRAEGRVQLEQTEALDVLAAYDIPIAAARTATNADAAVSAADVIGYPVVLKLVASEITHKTDVGGVRVNLGDAGAVRAAFDGIMASLKEARPDVTAQGVLVQAMHGGGVETIVGVSRDPGFGPLVMFGLGGIFVEVLQDVAFRVAPLTPLDAADLVSAIRGQALLQGFRGQPPVDRTAVERVILAVARLILDFPEIAELDINPLLASSTGAIALDARITLSG